jgi:catechol 2,3-dioxygenase-like lactoylglutathione lyase family enzyme
MSELKAPNAKKGAAMTDGDDSKVARESARLRRRPLQRLGVLVILAGMIGVSGLMAQIRAGETAGPVTITGIAYVRVKVTDVEKAKAFYGGVLGLASGEVRNGNAVKASFQVNPDQRVELTRTAAGTGGSYLVEIGLATDDLMKMRTYLTAKGVVADKIMAWPDGTRHFETQDPEGNKIVFVKQTRDVKEVASSPGAVGKKMLHAGFVVKDLKTERHFYEDILGFRLYWRGGFKNDGIDWYEIQVPDGDNWIEFMLNIPVTADHKELGVQNHFSLGVADVKTTAAQLRAKGAKQFDGPEVGRDGKDSIDIYDPDGTRVELMEFTPVEKPCCTEYTGAHPKP